MDKVKQDQANAKFGPEYATMKGNAGVTHGESRQDFAHFGSAARKGRKMQAQIKIVDDAGASPMAAIRALKEKRRALHDRVGPLRAACARLGMAEGAQREAEAAVAAFGQEGKVAAMREWASMASAGDPPPPGMERRRDLAERLAEAQAANEAAKGAAAGIQNELANIPADLEAIEGEIEAAALDLMQRELAPLAAELEEAAQAFASLLAAVQTPFRVIAEYGRTLIANGHQAAGVNWLRRAEAIGDPPRPDTWPDPDVIDAARAKWNARFQELVK